MAIVAAEPSKARQLLISWPVSVVGPIFLGSSLAVAEKPIDGQVWSLWNILFGTSALPASTEGLPRGRTRGIAQATERCYVRRIKGEYDRRPSCPLSSP